MSPEKISFILSFLKDVNRPPVDIPRNHQNMEWKYHPYNGTDNFLIAISLTKSRKKLLFYG